MHQTPWNPWLKYFLQKQEEVSRTQMTLRLTEKNPSIFMLHLVCKFSEATSKISDISYPSTERYGILMALELHRWHRE